MQLSTRTIQILQRKKQQIIEECGCQYGCADCQKKFQLLVKYAQANIPLKYWSLKFKDYVKSDKIKARIVQYVQNMVDNHESGKGLYLQGDTGLGKTFLACIILKAALLKGYSARFTTLAEAITLLSDSYYDKEARASFQQEILEVDYLVVDEIDKVNISTKNTFVEAAMDTLFRGRLNQLLPVIITANKTKEELAEEMSSSYGASLISLFDEHVIPVTFVGEDHRIIIQKEMRAQINGK